MGKRRMRKEKKKKAVKFFFPIHTLDTFRTLHLHYQRRHLLRLEKEYSKE